MFASEREGKWNRVYYPYQPDEQDENGPSSFILAEAELYSAANVQTTFIQSKWDSGVALLLLTLKFHPTLSFPIPDSIFLLLDTVRRNLNALAPRRETSCLCTYVGARIFLNLHRKFQNFPTHPVSIRRDQFTPGVLNKNIKSRERNASSLGIYKQLG